MRKLGKIKYIGLAIMSMFVLMGASECTETQKQDVSRQEAVETREDLFNRAEALHPVPQLNNFPMRASLVELTERQDMINHPWYIYVMGMNGEPVGYFVGKTYPISTCNFLSDSKRFVDLPDGAWGETTSPSLDGMFYGGGGASAACEALFFEDINSGAIHVFSATLWFASDKPLNLEMPEIATDESRSVEAEAEETPAPTPQPTEMPTQD